MTRPRCVIDATILFFPAAILRVLLGRAATSGFEVDVPVSWLAVGLELAIGWAYAATLISSGMRGTLGQQGALKRTNVVGQGFGRRHKPDYPTGSRPDLLSTTG